ncbi:DUF2520 domain-containing protein [Flavobacterium silvisoli]|uniref:DUF2520 domain-containing protein n=1 Tax=Flavobacterium silvisoli TaxID=2529433 RepID=A0A4Q9Z1B7_9FLAO|nr:Rossmann-like and DUF2520 domain-containing protein [Flavobacterium silvisoli]TBX70116.1 DUF2520 domain-containing protein [Flavobacterium silvisoli]
MIRVTLIGSGNVAQHLIQAFSKTTDVDLVQVFSRRTEAVTHLVDSRKVISDFTKLEETDVIIIAVTDDAIENVSNQILLHNQLVVHTSGSLAMTALHSNHRRGVFYPLQTFSKTKAIDFKHIPICLEAENETDYQTLENLARVISEVHYRVNSEQRRALHVAAVFVSNFVNHLYQIGDDICTENHLSFDILKPLIQETANKIMTLSPNEAQTGPAKRQDTTTINAHLSFLTDANQKEIYKLLTKSIIDNGKKL